MRTLLVTNDFPPKVGGIQTYLWELWRRLPPDDVTVLTTPHDAAVEFDADQPFRIHRTKAPVLLPSPGLAHQVDRLADETGSELVVLDPVLPVGAIGLGLRHPYAVVMHGSELISRLPGAGQLAGRILQGARHVIAAGGYPASETKRLAGSRCPPISVIPPGIDATRFRPLSEAERTEARRSFGLDPDQRLVVGISRLVRRKGFDVLLEAAGLLDGVAVAIGSTGRDHDRLARLIEEKHLPGRLLGRIPDDRLPALYGCGDLFAMLCHVRWGGLEVEGFGIVFVEAAACGVPQVAGASGGAADAVIDGETGVVVEHPRDAHAVAAAIGALLDDDDRRLAMGKEARRRAETDFNYDLLAARLATTLDGVV